MIKNLKQNSRKLLPAIILIFAGTVSAFAQSETVTLKAHNMPLRELLNLIEKKSPYTFAYADSEIPLDKKVSVKAENRSVASILHEVLPGANVKFENRKILLSSAAPQTKKGDKSSITQ